MFFYRQSPRPTVSTTCSQCVFIDILFKYFGRRICRQLFFSKFGCFIDVNRPNRPSSMIIALRIRYKSTDRGATDNTRLMEFQKEKRIVAKLSLLFINHMKNSSIYIQTSVHCRICIVPRMSNPMHQVKFQSVCVKNIAFCSDHIVLSDKSKIFIQYYFWIF